MDLAHRESTEEKASFVIRELPLKSRYAFDRRRAAFDRRIFTSVKRVSTFNMGFVKLYGRIATLAFLEISLVFLSYTFLTLRGHC